jgi:pyruvate formate lyase activating enzyme
VASLVTNIQGYSIHDGPGIRTVVFFKGCGLACRWCSNPECISSQPETGFIKNLCTRCGKCADICPEQALVYQDNGLPHIDHEKCNGCGKCSEVCSYKALVLYGQPLSPDEIYAMIARDKMFYDASGGGVTVSGGEALLQPDTVKGIFGKCRAAGIQTCIETSGFASGAALQQVLPYTDRLLFDLKVMDSGKHKQYTGQPNDVILANARTAAASGVEILFRMPLVPGVNDDEKNIKETAAFLHTMKKNNIELMPYHRLGKGKYDSLGKRYPMGDLPPATQEQIGTVIKSYEKEGITCTVSR